MVDTLFNKNDDKNQGLRDELRKRLRRVRANLTPDQIQNHSSIICDRLLSLLGDARSIGGYLAMGAEVNVSAIATHLGSDTHQYCVPIVMDQHGMKFAPLDESTPMERNRYGIREPVVDDQSLVSGMDLDVVLVPLVGFDGHRNRMGMGGGYYDRCFERRKTLAPPPLLIGVAYECQCVNDVFPEQWDVPLDYVVTEERILGAP